MIFWSVRLYTRKGVGGVNRKQDKERIEVQNF